jgi:hypothetical protein
MTARATGPSGPDVRRALELPEHISMSPERWPATHAHAQSALLRANRKRAKPVLTHTKSIWAALNHSQPDFDYGKLSALSSLSVRPSP